MADSESSGRGALAASNDSQAATAAADEPADLWAEERESLLAASERALSGGSSEGNDDPEKRFERKTKNVFLLAGAGSLAAQAVLFTSFTDIQAALLPSDVNFSLHAQNVHAAVFLAISALCVYYRTDWLMLPRRIAALFGSSLAVSFLALVTFIVAPALSLALRLTILLTLVAAVTVVTVLLIPVILGLSLSMPHTPSSEAAVGQGASSGLLSAAAILISLVAAGRAYLLTMWVLVVLFQAAGLAAILYLAHAGPWHNDIRSLENSLAALPAQADLETASDAPAAGSDGAVVGGSTLEAAESDGLHANLVAAWPIIKRTWIPLLGVFLPPLISFALFPAFSVGLGFANSRRFSVMMVATFHLADLLGRNLVRMVPNNWAVIPDTVVVASSVMRFAYLPLFVGLARALPGSLLAKCGTKFIAQGSLAFTNGWYVGSAFESRIDKVVLPQDLSRAKFYFSLANAMAVPAGAVLMNLLWVSGGFPALG